MDKAFIGLLHLAGTLKYAKTSCNDISRDIFLVTLPIDLMTGEQERKEIKVIKVKCLQPSEVRLLQYVHATKAE